MTQRDCLLCLHSTFADDDEDDEDDDEDEGDDEDEDEDEDEEEMLAQVTKVSTALRNVKHAPYVCASQH